ncbi:MAG: hypothetical protein Q9215_004660 [Flavoplaca cf. flavocitrina]
MSLSEQEEEDMRRAIALSLGHASSNQQKKHEVIVVDSDSSTTDDEAPCVTAATRPILPERETESAIDKPMMGILGLDRKAMEQERLARKRKASISPPPARRKTPKLAETTSKEPTSSASTPQIDASTKIIPSFHFSKLPHANGAVKKTWALGHPRDNDIKLEEILQKEDLNLAVLSSFQWDVEWLLRKIKTNATQMVFVMQADTEEIKTEYRNDTARMPNVRLCFPSMEGQVNCMHSKLMLLSYPTHLRVVVPTANLVPYDWGETGIMENTVFLIDLPRLAPKPTTSASPTMTNFGEDLIHFLEAMGLERSIIDSMHHFDFSATKDLAFVHTIGGANSSDGPSWRRTGYCGLGRAISQLGLTTEDALNIDYITSSVGSLNTEFLSTLYLAAQGDEGTAVYKWRHTPASQLSKLVDRNMRAAQQTAQKQVAAGFRIYFPSLETVRASTGGPHNGGTICFQSKWWNSATFPRDLLRDCKSRREGMLMHNKIIYVYPTSQPLTTSHTSTSKSWCYIGSANCSESAWGRLVKDRQTKQPKLNCRNWECGVVIPFRRAAAMAHSGSKERTGGKAAEDTDKEQSGKDGKAKERSSGLKAFEKVMPVPMKYPGKEYGDGDTPWFNAG